MTPWPKCKVQMRNGDLVNAEIAERSVTTVTVRIQTEPYSIPGNYGMQIVDYKYMDVKLEYIRE